MTCPQRTSDREPTVGVSTSCAPPRITACNGSGFFLVSSQKDQEIALRPGFQFTLSNGTAKQQHFANVSWHQPAVSQAAGIALIRKLNAGVELITLAVLGADIDGDAYHAVALWAKIVLVVDPSALISLRI